MVKFHVAHPRLAPALLDDIARRYSSGEPGQSIAATLEISHRTVYRYLNDLGVSRRTPSQSATRYTLNTRYFANVDSEAPAYWLGFLAADGSVMHRPGQSVLSLMLCNRDRGHIEKLRTALNATAPINAYQQSNGARRHASARLQVVSDALCDDLARWGVAPGKTARLSPPDLPDHLLGHYYRGYFDGDGCVSRRANGNWTVSCIGSRDLIQGFASWLAATAGVHDRIRADRSVWTWYYGGNRQVPRILAALYDDATVYLDRKHDLYKLAIRRPGCSGASRTR